MHPHFLPNSRSRIFRMALLFSLALMTIACKKDPPLPDYDPPDSSFGLIYTNLLVPSCGVSGCHDGASIHPRLIGENTWENMITDHVHNGQAEDAGLHLVKPFSADSSFFYQKMIYDSSAFQFGSPMPQGGLTVAANKIEFVRQWIEVGASKEGHVVADRSLIE